MRARLAISRDRLAAAPASGKNKDRGKNKTNKNLAAFRRALLRWYDRNRRDLPWRESRDPYRIWLSEIMLQQTRVAAVLVHYRIFLERFPNVEALATASEDAVLAAWSGLGYYRRARSLRQCAREIVQKRAGRFPQRAEDLETLPGIGRYTAAAIASIAFGEAVAVVDGNVERVLRRIAGIDRNGTTTTAAEPRLGMAQNLAHNLSRAQIWNHAQELLATSRPGDFNQAMMELGATVCIPREPRCQACPVQKWCTTHQSSQSACSALRVERVASPPAQRRISIRQIKKNVWCLLNERRAAILLVQRPNKFSLMPGMWELPLLSAAPRGLPDSARWRTFRHSITITDYTVHVLRNLPLRGLPPAYAKGKSKWIAAASIPQMPITGLTRKILKAAGII
jgi:A/G-specific adenine glycosylase